MDAGLWHIASGIGDQDSVLLFCNVDVYFYCRRQLLFSHVTFINKLFDNFLAKSGLGRSGVHGKIDAGTSSVKHPDTRIWNPLLLSLNIDGILVGVIINIISLSLSILT